MTGLNYSQFFEQKIHRGFEAEALFPPDVHWLLLRFAGGFPAKVQCQPQKLRNVPDFLHSPKFYFYRPKDNSSLRRRADEYLHRLPILSPQPRSNRDASRLPYCTGFATTFLT